MDAPTTTPLSSAELDGGQLDGGLDDIAAAPRHVGALRLIVRRPSIEEREVLAEGHLDTASGLVGDNWLVRGSSRTPDGRAHPDAQVTVMSWRVARLLAGSDERVRLAGDQLYVDLDLSVANLPAGTRLAIGDAVLEVTAKPHTGCAKFVKRFGADAMRWVNSPLGLQLRLPSSPQLFAAYRRLIAGLSWHSGPQGDGLPHQPRLCNTAATCAATEHGAPNTSTDPYRSVISPRTAAALSRAASRNARSAAWLATPSSSTASA